MGGERKIGACTSVFRRTVPGFPALGQVSASCCQTNRLGAVTVFFFVALTVNWIHLFLTIKIYHMKKLIAFCFVSALWIASTSFSGKWGGDMFAIYLNGKQVLRQFVHIDQSVKTLSLVSRSEKDKIEVLYSHCGQAGKSRVISLRDEKNRLVKKLSFGDGSDDESLMGFSRSELGRTKEAKLDLYYSSKELPEGKLLARIVWQEAKAVVKL